MQYHFTMRPLLWGITFVLSSVLSHAEDGLAAKYPGDAGIEADPQVVFVENFGEDSLEALYKRWDSTGWVDEMSFSTDVPAGSAAKQSLTMSREKGEGGRLFRRIANKAGGWGYDQIYARYYVKFDPECNDLHHFGTCLGGNNPPTRWPVVNAGYRTEGDKSFWSGIEPSGGAWTWDYYTYWSGMWGSPPNGKTWGNSFVQKPELKVEKGRWICVEHMMKMNDVGDTNGEQALWIDGQKVSHVGKGFPTGLWRFDRFYPGRGGEGIRWNDQKGDHEHFDTPPGGAPFEGFRWRTVPELNVNFVWLYIYTEREEGYRIKVQFSNVVLATSYIGPIKKM